MTPDLFKGQWKQYSFIQFAGFLFIVFIGLNASAETNILPGERFQPPTRFLWALGIQQFIGQSEKIINRNEALGAQYFSSPENALDVIRKRDCAIKGNVTSFECNENEEVPEYEGWFWRFSGVNNNGLISATTSKFGICPVNLDPSKPNGYSLINSPDPLLIGSARGYIACPIPSYPDGEKDLAKPQECGNRTPNPVHIGLGRKEITIPLYSTGSNAFPIDFQLYYQHNDEKRLGVTWRHTYYKFVVVDGQEVPTSARVYRGKGTLLFNKDQTTGEWQGDDDINDLLTEVFDSNDQRIGWVYLDRFVDKVENYDLNGRLTSIIDKSGLTHTLSYNSNGNLTVITDAHGQQLQFTHDTKGNFSTLTDPAGGLYQFFYDEIHNNLISVTYPDGKVRIYHYNEPAYTSNTNLSRALTGITDENGVRYATYTYDTQGRVIVTELASGTNRHMLAYSPNGSNTVVTDPLGSQYTHQFQNILGVAKKVSQSQPAGAGCNAASSATTYDVNGNVASRTDFNGNKTCFAFDLNRNLEIARVEGIAAGSVCPSDLLTYTPASVAERKTLTSWHVDFHLPTLITEAQRETSINYDTYGNVTLLSIRDTASNDTRTWNTSYVYHPTVSGVITQKIEDGPRTDILDITTINYYAPDENCAGGHMGCRGQIASITNALGHVTYITRYNAHGQPEVIIDPNGLNTTLVYDIRQRLISRTTGTEITDYQYDDVGQVTRITFPDNSFLAYTYDDAHRLIEIADILNNRIRYTLDAAGNRTKEEIFDTTGALTQIRSQEFDALSRLWKTIGAQNQITELGYDPNGNLKEASDPLQNTTTSQFDTLNRLIQITDPVGGQTQQDLNTLDQITRVTTGLVGNQPPPDPELQDREPPVPDPTGIDTTYTYNGLGDLLQEVSADRGATTYTYDAAGNQITLTDARGVVETTTYDALNRQTGRTYVTVTGVPNIDPITWTYDAGSNGIGRLTGMADESGSATYSYDLHGRLLSKIQTVKFGARSFIQTLSYQYDSSGRLSQTTYPSGTQINTLYGVDGRPTEIRVNGTALIQNITYQPFGAAKGWTWGNGQAHTRSFDLDGRIIQHPIGSDTRTLTYDAASQIIKTSDTNPAYNRGYSYDELGRLIGRSDNTSFRLWTYDANSNRTSVQSGSNIYPYTLDANSNRLMSVAGPVAKTYTYDAMGNVVNDGMTTFTWNAAGRLRKIVKGNKVRRYKYNGVGERLRRNGADKKRSAFLYDAAGHLISEYKAKNIRKENWRLKQETVWLDDIPVAVLKQPENTDSMQAYLIHADHLNTPRVIVDANNTPVWRWENRQAFGDNFPDEDPDRDGTLFKYNLRFAGQYFDNETRLHYNYFRNYDPETGRYISSDPIGLAGGLNTYTYVLNNPLSFIDPKGLAAFSIGIGGSFQQTAAGGSMSVNIGVDTIGQFCFQLTSCGRFGPGVSAGTTVNFAVSKGTFCDGNSLNIGFFGEGGAGLFGGGSLDLGSAGLSASGSVDIGIGGGVAAGSQICIIRTKCL